MMSAQKSQSGSIAIMVASADEMERMQPAVELLDDLDCPYDVLLASAWTDPERLIDWARTAHERGIQVFIVAAGVENALPGFVAASCNLPVVGVPMVDESSAMLLAPPAGAPPTAPVAWVGEDQAHLAALFAVRILAAADPDWAEAIEGDRQRCIEDLEGQNDEVREKYVAHAPEPVRRKGRIRKIARPAPETPEAPGAIRPVPPKDKPVRIRPADIDRPLNEPDEEVESKQTPAAPPLNQAPRLGRHRIEPDEPDVMLIEEAVDCLLDGGVVALPTETVYGLAVDATNPDAVEQLYALKDRDRDKPITLMVDSPKMLAAIARNLTVEIRRLMEAFWPGPLTIVFEKRGENFQHITRGDTIGVRLPDHSTPLALMQALARPLACTSANLSGAAEAHTADAVEVAFGDSINLILDAGQLELQPASTVVDITGEPYRILRAGSVTPEQLAAIVGEKMEPED